MIDFLIFFIPTAICFYGIGFFHGYCKANGIKYIKISIAKKDSH